MNIFQEWEPIIGLEIHVELNTKSKLFSSAMNCFGSEPNVNITEVCTGQPGSLPVLNGEAVKKAVLLGCALNANVSKYSRFDRKSYFYPDSPRNFQITQYEMPIVVGGSFVADVCGVEKTFIIKQAHLEDDAGMLKHFSNFAGIDYNRAGVPLIEIVSQPCIFSVDEAVAYATGLKAILQYLDVSDCNMEEGSLRMDVNISVRPKGSKELRNKIEIKNLNSFSFMGMALESEFKRQVNFYLQNPEKIIEPATYRWDADRKETVLMRRKESADDYRYFLEPDLPPLILEEEYIDHVRHMLPELPYEREKRYINEYKIPRESAVILVNEKKLADFFEMALKVCKNAKSLANWILVEFIGRYKELGKLLWESGLPAENVGKLVNLIDCGSITGKIAKQIADIMVQSPEKDPEEIISENVDFVPLNDEKVLHGVIQEVIANNEQSVVDFLNGKSRSLDFLVGQVMKKTKGTANPTLLRTMIQEAIAKNRHPSK